MDLHINLWLKILMDLKINAHDKVVELEIPDNNSILQLSNFNNFANA